MADNELELMQWQVGTQSAFSTAVTQTAKLMGITGGSIKPGVESSILADVRGTLTPGHIVTLDKQNGTASIEGDITYEDVDYWLDTTFGQVAPTGAGPYVRVHSGPGAKVAPRILTLTHGATGLDVKSLVGGIGSKFGFQFESNKRATFKQELIGYKVADATLASLSDRTVIPVHSNQVTVFLDAWAGTMGATSLAVAKYSISGDFDLNKILQEGVGSLNPVGHKQKRAESGSNTIKVAMEVDTQSKAFMDSILTATPVLGPWKAQLRILATYDATHTMQIDFAGFAAEAPEMYTDADGIAQFEFTLQALYHTTLATWLKITTTNSVAILA